MTNSLRSQTAHLLQALVGLYQTLHDICDEMDVTHSWSISLCEAKSALRLLDRCQDADYATIAALSDCLKRHEDILQTLKLSATEVWVANLRREWSAELSHVKNLHHGLARRMGGNSAVAEVP
jgi:hypothetical protein